MSDVTENENFIEIDETIRHEALDRCLMISDILSAHLLEHPFIETNEQLSDKIQGILNDLIEVYEEISEANIIEGTKYAIEEIEEIELIDDGENNDEDSDDGVGFGEEAEPEELEESEESEEKTETVAA